MLGRVALILSGAVGLAACSGGSGGRYVTAANSTVLVVVDAVVREGKTATANVHYIVAEPQRMGEAGSECLLRMEYAALFDCDAGMSAVRRTTTHFESGQTITQDIPTPEWKASAAGSVGAGIHRTACDPKYARSVATLNSLETLERTYRNKLAARRR